MKDNVFWDTNLWVYLMIDSVNAQDQLKKATLQTLLGGGMNIHISVQVFNEVINVLTKKYGVPLSIVKEYIEHIASIAHIHSVTQDTVYQALDLKQRYIFSWYDSLIVSAASIAGCNLLYSEDLQNGLIVNQHIQIINPFL